MRREYPGVEFCRYADDGVIHFKSYHQAEALLGKLAERFLSCGLEIHPLKTKIVYCKTEKRKGKFKNVCFDFLGFTFRPRPARDKSGKVFLSYLPGVSKDSLTHMRQEVRQWKIHLKPSVGLEHLSKMFNSKIRGWINYYSKFYKSGLYPLWISINKCLIKWIRRKYKRFATNQTKAVYLLGEIAHKKTFLFSHWEFGLRPTRE